MVFLQKHAQIALGYFLIIAALGVALRLFSVFDMPITYRFVVHGHSHIALLGWVYTGLTTLMYFLFLRKKHLGRKYRILFWATQTTLIGMLISFPFTGYALFSILFSTLFLLTSYVFTFLFLKHSAAVQRNRPSHILLRTALWYMVLSSIGPWALGIIMVTLGNDSHWYKNAIYFYLHFQYNGWFLVALVALFFYLLESMSVTLSRQNFRLFYNLLNAGVILTFFISLLWMEPHPVIYGLAALGGVLQIGAFTLLFAKVLNNRFTLAKRLPSSTKYFLKLAAICLAIKLIAQVMGVFPAPAQIISGNIDFVISYLHWVFLGFVSVGIFAFLNHFKLATISKNVTVAYMGAFLTTEVLIFYRGAVAAFDAPPLPHLNLWLGVASSLLMLAIGWMFLQNVISKSN